MQLCQGPGRPKSSSHRKDVVQKHGQAHVCPFKVHQYAFARLQAYHRSFKFALVFQKTCVVYTQALCSEIESNFFCRTTFVLKVNGVCALCFNFLGLLFSLALLTCGLWHTPFESTCGNACPNPRGVCAHSAVPFDWLQSCSTSF